MEAPCQPAMIGNEDGWRPRWEHVFVSRKLKKNKKDTDSSQTITTCGGVCSRGSSGLSLVRNDFVFQKRGGDETDKCNLLTSLHTTLRDEILQLPED